MPKDRVTSIHQNYGFIEFLSEADAEYAIKILNMIKIFGKPIRVNKVRVSAVAGRSFAAAPGSTSLHCCGHAMAGNGSGLGG